MRSVRNKDKWKPVDFYLKTKQSTDFSQFSLLSCLPALLIIYNHSKEKLCIFVIFVTFHESKLQTNL